MGRMRVRAAGEKRRAGCVVNGCANVPGKGLLICAVHAAALRPAPQPADDTSRTGSSGEATTHGARPTTRP